MYQEADVLHQHTFHAIGAELQFVLTLKGRFGLLLVSLCDWSYNQCNASSQLCIYCHIRHPGPMTLCRCHKVRTIWQDAFITSMSLVSLPSCELAEPVLLILIVSLCLIGCCCFFWQGIHVASAVDICTHDISDVVANSR